MSDTTVRTQRFYGLNRQTFCEEGEMVDMKNLCSGAFPYIKTRECRDEYKSYVTVDAKLGEGKYMADVAELPPAGEVTLGDIYRLTSNKSAFEPGGIYTSEGSVWVKKDEGDYIARAAVSIQGSLTLNPSLRTDLYRQDNSNVTYDIGWPLSDYINYRGPNHLRYLGDTTEGFIHGRTYKYNIKVIEKYWEIYTGTRAANDKGISPPDIDSVGVGYIYTFTSNIDIGEFKAHKMYQCIWHIQGCWEEADDPYDIVSEYVEPTEEGKTVRYCGDVTSPVYDSRYMVDKDFYNENDIYFFSLTEKSEGETDVEELPEPSEETYGNVYRYITPSESGFYVCKNGAQGYIWEQCAHPIVVKHLSMNDYVSEYSQVLGIAEYNVKRILRIHEHNGKLAVLLENDEGETALYYDNKLTLVSASDRTRMLSMGNLIMLGDGNTYYDTKNKEIKAGTDTFDFSLYGLRYSMMYNGGYGVVHVLFESYINSHEIVLYSETKEYFESALATFNSADIDFEIKTDHNGGWEYVTTSGPATLTYPTYGIKWGEDDWKDIGRWELKIPIQTMLFPPQLCTRNDGRGEGWVYLRKASKNTRFLWKNRLWGYDENNLISSILGVLDDNMDVDWQTVADGRNDNGAYTLSFMQGGDVTGIAALRDYITVFKRSHLCTLSGNTSATFLMNTISAFGLSEENEKSIAVCGNTVFYMSDDGVYTFSGDYPMLISEKAKLEGRPVTAAADNRFYYLSLEKDGTYTNYRYDIQKGIWYKMNNTHISQYCQLNGKMLYIDADTEKIMTVGEKEEIEWETVLTFDEGTWRKKKYKAFAIYGDFDEIDIYAKTDDGVEKAIRHTKKQERFVVMPIECETLTITICGRGEAIIKGFEREFEVI